MAKALVLSILVSLNEVFWDPTKNYGRHTALVDNEQGRCEHAVMLMDGWDPNQPIEVSEFDEAGLKRVETIITAEMAALEGLQSDSKYPTLGAETKLNMAQRREAYKALYFPDGKIKLPKYDATFAFQRGKALPDTIALIVAATGKKVTDVVKGYNLPVRVVQYANEAERVKACGLENTRKDTGRKSIMKHWPSLFQLAYDYFVAKPSASMAEINELLAGGVVKNNNDGIKVHSLLSLDHRFPELGIKDKVLNAGMDKDGKDLGQEWTATLDRTRVWKMVQWLDKEKAAKDKAAGVDYADETTQDTVAQYLASPNADKDEKIVPASKALINTNMNLTPNLIEKYILFAVATGKMELLAKFRTPTLSIEKLAAMNALAVELGIANTKGELVK